MKLSEQHLIEMPVRLAAIGAGNRMRTYMQYVEKNPHAVRLVAVIEPDSVRRNMLADRFGVPQEMRFASDKDFFALPHVADAVVICSPDKFHYPQSLMAIEKGYHILLEKPIARSAEECEEILRRSDEAGVRVSVCHVLRFHAMFLKIKELVASGRYGKIIGITHNEGVGIDRATHSYVRGTMNSEEENTSLLLAKCCHDVDLLLWISGGRCRAVSSFGSLRWFRKENAPASAALRCIDCAEEMQCPFSAVDLYKRRRDWIRNFIPGPGQTVDDVIDNELHEGRYGRCVYHCDNDLVDNQSVMMRMCDGVIISLIINVFTQRDCRNVEIRMSEGEIICDGDTIRARHFRSRETATYDFSHLRKIHAHGGADLALFANFIENLRNQEVPLGAPLQEIIDSHNVIFEAERSRKLGVTLAIGSSADIN